MNVDCRLKKKTLNSNKKALVAVIIKVIWRFARCNSASR